MASKILERFIGVIAFYVLLTVLPVAAHLVGIKDVSIELAGDWYAGLSVFVAVLWAMVGRGFVRTGKF